MSETSLMRQGMEDTLCFSAIAVKVGTRTLDGFASTWDWKGCGWKCKKTGPKEMIFVLVQEKFGAEVRHPSCYPL